MDLNVMHCDALCTFGTCLYNDKLCIDTMDTYIRKEVQDIYLLEWHSTEHI